MATNMAGRLLLAVGLMCACAAANAAIFRSYLSVAGNDANPCTLPLPCRLLPAALAAANDGGEIWMLDSANFNSGTVIVNKSVTILAIPGALGSIVANGADAIAIGAPGAKVTLRNLVILNLAGTNNIGVSMGQGSALTLEGCELYGLNTGVAVSGAAVALTIKDTTIRDNTANGVSLAGPVKASLRNASLLNNAVTGLTVANGASATLGSSAVVGSATGILAAASGSTTAQVAVTGSTVSGNTTGVQVTAAAGTDSAQVMLNAVTFSQNGTGVNITGATASVSSRQNNTFRFNTADIGTGTFTPLAAQ